MFGVLKKLFRKKTKLRNPAKAIKLGSVATNLVRTPEPSPSCQPGVAWSPCPVMSTPIAPEAKPPLRAKVPMAPHSYRITVKRGQTLYAISRRYGVPAPLIIEENGLCPLDSLTAGRYLFLPGVREHIVKPGETFDSIARANGVKARALARTNRLAAPYAIHIGQSLALPAPVTYHSDPPDPAMPPATIAPAVAPPPRAPAAEPAKRPSRRPKRKARSVAKSPSRSHRRSRKTHRQSVSA